MCDVEVQGLAFSFSWFLHLSQKNHQIFEGISCLQTRMVLVPHTSFMASGKVVRQTRLFEFDNSIEETICFSYVKRPCCIVTQNPRHWYWLSILSGIKSINAATIAEGCVNLMPVFFIGQANG